MRFTINLATRPYLDQRLVRQVCIGVMVLLLALLIWNGSRIVQGMGELRRFEAESAALEVRLGGRTPEVSEKEYARLLSGIRFYNGIIQRKSHNWLGLLDRVESVTPEGIALMSLKPDKGGAELKLEGRAKNFGMVRGYLEQLDDSPAFSDILLLSHHDVLLGERGRGVQFTISCRVVER